MDMKEKPIPYAQKMKKTFGDRICIHTLLIGDSPEGRSENRRVEFKPIQ